jgi:hypothetical protein
MQRLEVSGSSMVLEPSSVWKCKWPYTVWHRVWKNVWNTPVDRHAVAVRYKVIHYIIPTRFRLHAIHLVPTDLCPMCSTTDTFTHHLTECGQGTRHWEWTRVRLALMLRSEKRWIPTEWLLRQQFHLWPPPRHRAVLMDPSNLHSIQKPTGNPSDAKWPVRLPPTSQAQNVSVPEPHAPCWELSWRFGMVMSI